MIVKRRDAKQVDIDILTSLLSLRLPKNKKFPIERELRFIKSGDKGEEDSAYFIDFHFGASKKWAVIHDLRLEHDGRVAQIDHLMINRFLEVYVLESKNFFYGVKITDTGEFLVYHEGKYVSVESPIEQNKRHLIVLEAVFKQYDLMPKRLGLTMTPTLRSYVLVSTNSRVIRPPKERFDTDTVIKADTLRTQIDKDVEALRPLSVIAAASKMSSLEKVTEITRRLVSLHKPLKIDYLKRFGIDDSPSVRTSATHSGEAGQTKGFYCSKCKKTITRKVARFCWDNEQRFGGRAYCFDCQKTVQNRQIGES